MKTLTLFRHAKTEQDSSTGRDLDRALTEEGQEDSERVGAEIRDLGLHFDLILASPAKRSVESIERAKLPPPSYDERLYNAPPEELLEIVRSVLDEVDRLMLVGHNPGFERLASRLIGFDIEMPAGSLLEIALPIDLWLNIEDGSGLQVRFLKPKELA
jgi:phosphohistidine phosphatase